MIEVILYWLLMIIIFVSAGGIFSMFGAVYYFVLLTDSIQDELGIGLLSGFIFLLGLFFIEDRIKANNYIQFLPLLWMFTIIWLITPWIILICKKLFRLKGGVRMPRIIRWAFYLAFLALVWKFVFSIDQIGLFFVRLFGVHI